jgi:WD40 repeat protein
VSNSPDGTQLATASRDGTARIWDGATGYTRTTLTGHQGSAVAVAFSPDGCQLATASDDGIIRIWDTATGACQTTLLASPKGGSAVLLPDGSYKVTGDLGGILWWAIKLCRFEPGELDPYLDGIRRLPAAARLLP